MSQALVHAVFQQPLVTGAYWQRELWKGRACGPRPHNQQGTNLGPKPRSSSEATTHRHAHSALRCLVSFWETHVCQTGHPNNSQYFGKQWQPSDMKGEREKVCIRSEWKQVLYQIMSPVQYSLKNTHTHTHTNSLTTCVWKLSEVPFPCPQARQQTLCLRG